MAKVMGRPTVGGRHAGWIISLTVTGSEITGNGADAYEFDHLENAEVVFAISAEESAAEQGKIEKVGIDGITFETAEVSERIDIISGETVSGGDSTAGRESQIKVTSLATEAGADVSAIQAFRGKVVLMVLPHGKAYSAGSEAGLKYYCLIGKVSSITGPSFAGNDVATIALEVTGGKTYTEDAGTEISAAVTTFTAITPVGQDPLEVTIAAPAGAAVDAVKTVLLTGDIAIV